MKEKRKNLRMKKIIPELNEENDKKLEKKEDKEFEKEENIICQEVEKNESKWHVLVYNNTKTTVVFIFQSTSIYLLWIAIHYLSSHFYVQLCTPSTLSGFLMSPFLVSSPHCKALQWTMNRGTDVIENMWVVFGLWLSSYLLSSSYKK